MEPPKDRQALLASEACLASEAVQERGLHLEAAELEDRQRQHRQASHQLLTPHLVAPLQSEASAQEAHPRQAVHPEAERRRPEP